jgi:hypothetical protein
LRGSQKRRVQRLRNQELKQARIKRKLVWRPKDKPDASCRMNSWLQLIRLCRRRCRQTLMRLSKLG